MYTSTTRTNGATRDGLLPGPQSAMLILSVVQKLYTYFQCLINGPVASGLGPSAASMPLITFHMKQGTVALASKSAKTHHSLYLLSKNNHNLNHGHNVPVRIEPEGGSLVDGTGPCHVVDCIGDIASVCPSPLVAKNMDGKYIECNSACDVLKDPGACQPNEYSKTFKQASIRTSPHLSR
ncbi:hypothetical protein FH972_027104 [Carpinus fangiana]|uniref:Uncharacterized protein n=1 Tax=Carpinus fangiana TaxID=176857 RepID=A0A5N6L617_9ROSI|nr:hypothetical protein FH972_027104 [Carpinus fangiana]